MILGRTKKTVNFIYYRLTLPSHAAVNIKNEAQPALWFCETVNAYTATMYERKEKEKLFTIVKESGDKGT